MALECSTFIPDRAARRARLEIDNGIVAPDEKDTIWKAMGQGSAYFRLAAKTRESVRIRCSLHNDGIDFGEKILLQIGLLPAVPNSRVGDVDFGFDADDDAERAVS